MNNRLVRVIVLITALALGLLQCGFVGSMARAASIQTADVLIERADPLIETADVAA